MPFRVTIVLLASLITGCASITPSFYKLDVRQGNIFDADLIDQLRPGMSKPEVRSLLGTPLISDPFRQDRWDYVYLYYPSGDRSRGEQRQLTLFFDGEVLNQVRVGDSGES
jgi:outer membrane protein assembly factor BamE